MEEYFKIYYILRGSVFILNRYTFIEHSLGYMCLNNVYFSIYFYRIK